MVEYGFEFVGAELFVAHQVNQDSGIEIAGAGSHGDAAGRRAAHACVDANAVAQRAETGSVAEMRKNCARGNLRAELMNQRLIGESVEAVTPNSQVEEALRDRKMRGDLGDGFVKSIVEAGIVFRLRENLLGRSHERQSLRDVQRREMGRGAE